MGETYYEVLAVDPDATRDEIESAYRDRVLETHPDHSDDPDAAEQFKRVTTARSVLTDGTERARYDRLGHETYVGLAQGRGAADETDETEKTGGENAGGNGAEAGDDDGSVGGSETEQSTSNSRTNAETSSADTEAAGSGAGGERTDPFQQWASEWVSQSAETESTDRGPSHHARQRSKRRRRRAKQRARGEWPFDGERTRHNRGATAEATTTGEAAADTTSTGGATTGTAAADRATADRASAGGATAGAQEDEGFQYSVHDWDGDVDLEWERPPIDQTTAITVGFVAVCYPLFVAASLTPLFSLAVNAVVAACTFAVVGYLLTVPRIAVATFGTWSVLVPVGLVQFSSTDPFSPIGLLATAFVWVPLGYAVALWWVLRP